jgi:hypothetical protein
MATLIRSCSRYRGWRPCALLGEALLDLRDQWPIPRLARLAGILTSSALAIPVSKDERPSHARPPAGFVLAHKAAQAYGQVSAEAAARRRAAPPGQSTDPCGASAVVLAHAWRCWLMCRSCTRRLGVSLRVKSHQAVHGWCCGSGQVSWSRHICRFVFLRLQWRCRGKNSPDCRWSSDLFCFVGVVSSGCSVHAGR